ncbi:MAG: sensor histidine kinase [Brevibacillus sp.]|nr:sensor histidine kinase [Brevibacillus sp.]
MKKIWVKLACVLMAVGTMAILLSTVLSIKEMDYHFTMYLDEVRNQHNQEITQMAIQTYQQNHKWDEQVFEKMEAVSSVLGLQLSLYDAQHQLIMAWGKGVQQSRFVDDIPLISGGNPIGYLTIAHNDQNTYQSMEDHFQMAHTNAMQWTMYALILLVIFISIPLARTLVRPLVQMSAAATKVAKGNLHVRVEPPLGKDEISSLVKTFNNLVHSLQHQEELRKRLTSDIAHELRTPLNTLLAQVEGMIDGIWETSPAHLESTRGEVLRLSQLVSDLDQVIRVESGALRMNSVGVDLSEITQQVLDAMTATFTREQIQVRRELAECVWMVGDQQRLAQVVTNLLNNACKHTEAGGWIVVVVKETGGLASLQIQDNGTGIPKEDLPFVFERFYRGDRSRARESGGSGLGLTVVKGIVEAHGGEIILESEVGKGTMVTVTFPALHPPASP